MCSSAPTPGPGGNEGAAAGSTAQAGAASAGESALAGAAAIGGGGAAGSVAAQAGAGGALSAGAGGLSAGGASAAGGASSGPKGPSAGCQAPAPDEAQQMWLENKITVANLPDTQAAFAQRSYFVRLPVGYDHSKAYPIVFYGPGCGASGVESTPMMNDIKSVAIHVFLLQKDSCFSTGSYPSPEVPYFTQALNEVQAKYCTDAGKVYVSGFSSGAWLSSVLACAMGDRIRAIGTAAGGLNQSIVDGYKCPGNQLDTTPVTSHASVAGLFFTGALDTTNKAVNVGKDGNPNGVNAARDRLIKANGCDPNASEPWVNTFGADFCKIWKTGCPTAPVVYCVGPGVAHDNGQSLNIPNKGFWEFWSSLP